MVDVCLLGCGGMMPLPQRRLTALLYRFNGTKILIDCGEGTQVSVKQAGWGFKSIDAVCLTHYHADHTAGLPGFLLTLGNTGRSKPLTLMGPPGLAYVIKGLTVICPKLPFELNFIDLSALQRSQMKIGGILVSAQPVEHNVSCLAYRLDSQRNGVFLAERARELGIPQACWHKLQGGEHVNAGGRHFEPGIVLGPPRKGISVTYCTDTRPTQELIAFCGQSDLLICEGMYGDDAMRPEAIEKTHMTFSEAAELAKASEAKELWLTHFSPSLKDPNQYIEQTRHLFHNTHVGQDLMKKALIYTE